MGNGGARGSRCGVLTSLTIYRLYFGLLSSAGLIAAFWPWLRVLRPAVAPAAALFFSTIWFTAAFGSLVMPNLYVGLGAVAVTGLFVRAAYEPVWWRLVLTAAAAGFVALVRPTDSVLVMAPLFAIGLVVTRLRRLKVLAAVAIGDLWAGFHGSLRGMCGSVVQSKGFARRRPAGPMG